MHLFFECSITNQLWNQLTFSCEDEFNFPALIPQSAIVGLTDLSDNFTLLNHLLLAFKFCVYSVREKSLIDILQLKSVLKK